MGEYIRAIGDPPRRTNAAAVADCATLGYLDDTWRIVDLTYGMGRFWNDWRPGPAGELIALDLFPNPDRHHYADVLVRDFTATGFDDDTFDASVFDGPYKLNGSPNGGGPAEADRDYGVGGRYATPSARHALLVAGVHESARITRRGGYVLIKCMDQVASGRVHWQTRILADAMEAAGLRVVDRILVFGYREQPHDRRQRRVHADYSTLIIGRKGQR